MECLAWIDWPAGLERDRSSFSYNTDRKLLSAMTFNMQLDMEALLMVMVLADLSLRGHVPPGWCM